MSRSFSVPIHYRSWPNNLQNNRLGIPPKDGWIGTDRGIVFRKARILRGEKDKGEVATLAAASHAAISRALLRNATRTGCPAPGILLQADQNDVAHARGWREHDGRDASRPRKYGDSLGNAPRRPLGRWRTRLRNDRGQTAIEATAPSPLFSSGNSSGHRRATKGISALPVRRRKYWKRRRAIKLVGVARFELTTPASRRQCSTRLSYTPTVAGAVPSRAAFCNTLNACSERCAGRSGEGPTFAVSCRSLRANARAEPG